MKTYIFNKLALLALGGLLTASCGDFGTINDDPNNPTETNTSLLFTHALKKIQYSVYEGSNSYTAGPNLYNPWSQLYPQYFAERQNVQYGAYQVPTSGMGSFYLYFLKDLKTIIDMNSNDATKNEANVSALGTAANQIAAARTVSDIFYKNFTDVFGMIVYSDALKGDEGSFTPKLDSQKDVYTGLHKDLKEAYDQFDTGGSLSSTYDIIYGGDIAKWKKANASVRMLMAIKLSDVDPETGKAWFQEAYKDGVIEANADNLVYNYYADTDNENPLYYNIVTSGRADFTPCSTIIDKMNDLKDPRRAYYFTTNSDGIYKGVPIGLIQSEIGNYNKNISNFHPALYKQNSPVIVISAARMKLTEAEAALRGWISADARTLYEEGIKLSFEAKANLAGEAYNESDLEAYLAQTGVRFEGSTDDKIKLIALQRWINGYLEDGIEAWSDWRRLDYPTLKPGPAVTQWTHVPYRRVYSSDDKSANPDQFAKAIQEQGEDTYNTRVWWDVKDNE